jgi:hypothetical protein
VNRKDSFAEYTSQARTRGFGVCFDPDKTMLLGWYKDELSVYRAKKIWTAALHENFLLEPKHDFHFEHGFNNELQAHSLSCHFTTACARYAFWRITNSQAPEVQYLIETAHIPSSDNFTEEVIRTPDMRPIHEGPLVYSAQERKLEVNTGWVEGMKDLLDKIVDVVRVQKTEKDSE